MEVVYSLPFLVLEVPNLKIKKPSWFQQPSAMFVFFVVLFSYFLVTGGETNSKFTHPGYYLLFYLNLIHCT